MDGHGSSVFSHALAVFLPQPLYDILMLKIKFSDNVYAVEAVPGVMLSELIARTGLMLDLRCAGFGVCGRCRVDLLRGVFTVEGKTVKVGSEPVSAPACHTLIMGEYAEIAVPASSVVHSDGQITVDYEHILNKSPRAIPQSPWYPPLGIAIDIGTTTVAIVLIDLAQGEPLASVSSYNRQAICGDNVASRISYSMSGVDSLQRLRHLIVQETINPLLRRLLADAERSADEIGRVSVAGNTVMTHLFIGASPESIGVMPFEPLYRRFPEMTAQEAGLEINPAAIVYILPAVSGYIGGDLTAGIISSGLHYDGICSMIIDIGTNCEIVLRRGKELFACAAAAGPAFEGAGIACGSRAAAGAIDRIHIGKDLQFDFSTIEKAPAAGLCGSAIIDLLAEGFRCGMIDAWGRYNIELLRQSGRYLAVDYGRGPIHSCIIAIGAGGKPIYVAEPDIEQVLKAKAAVYAAVKSLLKQCDTSFCELEQVYLAGGFARYMRIEQAVEMGMLPPLRNGVYRKIGNSSLAGAVMSLIDLDFTTVAAAVIERPRVVELNTLPDFEDQFIDALMIPHFNPGEFALHET